MVKTGKILIDLVEMMNRSKSRSLSVANDEQKDDIVREYDRMREKVEQVMLMQKDEGQWYDRLDGWVVIIKAASFFLVSLVVVVVFASLA